MRPIQISYYKCDSVFHTEELKTLLEDSDKFGYIIADGNGTLFGTLQGCTKKILEKFTVDLPRKHGRGGQSKNRFERIRTERRHNYLREISEGAVDNFIENNLPNVKGLIIAGSADIKTDLIKSDLFDPRLNEVVIKVVDISYGGVSGFNQAIALSMDCVKNQRLLYERKILGRFFDEIAKDTGKYVFGPNDTWEHILNGYVDVLIVNQDFDYERLELKLVDNKSNGNSNTINGNGAKNISIIVPPDKIGTCNGGAQKFVYNNAEYEIVQRTCLLEWLMEENNYLKYVSSMEIVSDTSTEGTQFVKGFGGFGGILRYRIENSNEMFSEEANDFKEEDFI